VSSSRLPGGKWTSRVCQEREAYNPGNGVSTSVRPRNVARARGEEKVGVARRYHPGYQGAGKSAVQRTSREPGHEAGIQALFRTRTGDPLLTMNVSGN
jgi:hypothetical protein